MKKIISSFLFIIAFLIILSNKVNAISFNLDIKGDKTVAINETIQLKSEYWVGNDIYLPDLPNGGVGEVSREDVTEKSTWKSSDTNIATVDNKGKVTGKAEGTATITAIYYFQGEEYRDATYLVEVKNKSNEEELGIFFYYDEPGPSMIKDSEYQFGVGLKNIPKSEKENIKFTIENESIAKIIKTNFNVNTTDAVATVKFLSVGKTKLVASLNYNGKTYSKSYEIDVIDSNCFLTISAQGQSILPTEFNIGENIQLIATLEYRQGSLIPINVTSDGTNWTSSDNEIASIDNKGYITIKGEGTVTITAEYSKEKITAKYTFKCVNSTISPINPGTTGSNSSDSPTTNNNPTTAKTVLPKTGRNITIISIGIALILTVSVATYMKYRKIND